MWEPLEPFLGGRCLCSGFLLCVGTAALGGCLCLVLTRGDSGWPTWPGGRGMGDGGAGRALGGTVVALGALRGVWRVLGGVQVPGEGLQRQRERGDSLMV